MTERIEADVCVVGAGYAGLCAARRLKQAGLSVVVLEARDRVGGRVWTRVLDDGTALDMGGTWLGPGQDAAYDLARELNIATYPTYSTGETVFVDAQGKVSGYKGQIPRIGPFPVLSLGFGMFRLDGMAKSLPLDQPWTGKHATAWDAKNTSEWIDAKVPTDTAKHLLRAAVRGLLTADPSEISLLHLLFLIRSSKNGLNGLLSIENGYQQDRLTGGAQSMANAIAQDLGGAIHLISPVDAVEQDRDGVTVRGATLDVRARRVVMAIPPKLAARLPYEPSLPTEHIRLREQMPGGGLLKVMTVYEEPFWRAEGRSGMSVAMEPPIESTLDASPKSGRGVLASFAFGPFAREMAERAPGERRRVVLDTLRARFGAKGGEPIMYEEVSWEDEEYTRGCSAAHMGPGVLSRYGPWLQQPAGLIHWAGSETATKSHAAIDGAIRSGYRAAEEVKSALV